MFRQTVVLAVGDQTGLRSMPRLRIIRRCVQDQFSLVVELLHEFPRLLNLVHQYGHQTARGRAFGAQRISDANALRGVRWPSAVLVSFRKEFTVWISAARSSAAVTPSAAAARRHRAVSQPSDFPSEVEQHVWIDLPAYIVRIEHDLVAVP
jgi:hypothetical protein